MIFPCLVLRSKGSQEKGRKRVKDMRKEIPTKLARSMLEPELTLDEAYFPSLPTDVLNKRNETQVVSRKRRGTQANEDTEHDTQPILVVTQLWIWRYNSYILTAFSENDPENIGYWEQEHLQDYTHLLSSIVSGSPVLPGIRVGLILAHQISEFDNPQTDGEFGNLKRHVKFQSPLDIFEESTAKVLDDVDEYMSLTVQSQSRLDIKKEHDFMFQIANIREELAMIYQVLEQQSEFLQAFIEDSERYDPDLRSSPGHESTQEPNNEGKETMEEQEAEKNKKWEKVKNSKNLIKKYQKRVKKIDADASRVEKQIQNLLNLKRTYASMEDARASVNLGAASIELGTAGLILSTAVAGFTIITIIFAPLAFVTALFALPIDTLLSKQVPFDRSGGNSQADSDAQVTVAYPTSYIATWFAVAEVVSLTVTFLLVTLCVWPFLKRFSALQENLSGNTPDDTATAAGEASEAGATSAAGVTLGQEQTSLRRRIGKQLFRRHLRRSSAGNCESGQSGQPGTN
ncbi:hypothetical protein F4802DRAFT_191334 [Xylaria palmicola]|nr:hypothetical protein F4802DRAFT_191334 [Xylaria palmicola]